MVGCKEDVRFDSMKVGEFRDLERNGGGIEGENGVKRRKGLSEVGSVSSRVENDVLSSERQTWIDWKREVEVGDESDVLDE